MAETLTRDHASYDAGLTRLNTVKFMIVAAVAVYCSWYVQTAADGHVVDGINGALNIAGRIAFGTFGQFMFYLGGSLMQVLVPLGFIGYACWRRDFYPAALLGFWLGINLINIAACAGDAVRQTTSLSGNQDWAWLLASLHAVAHTDKIALGLRVTAYACFAVAAIGGIVLSREAVLAPVLIPDPAVPVALRTAATVVAYTPPRPTIGAVLFHSDHGVVLKLVAFGAVVALAQHGGNWWRELTHPFVVKSPWSSDLKAAMARAHQEHKPVLLSFTGSDWCSACAALDDQVLNTATFRNYVAKNAVFVELDFPKYASQPDAIKKQNQELAQEFEIQGFPTVVVLNSHGKDLGELVGCPSNASPQTYIAEIEKRIRAGGPN